MIVYNGYHNKNECLLTATLDGAVQSLADATKVEVVIGGLAWDSERYPEMFDLSDLVGGNVGLDLSNLMPQGLYALRFVTYHPDKPDGAVWLHETDADPESVRFIGDQE